MRDPCHDVVNGDRRSERRGQWTRSPEYVAKAGDWELRRHCVIRLGSDILAPTEAMLPSAVCGGRECNLHTLAAVCRLSCGWMLCGACSKIVGIPGAVRRDPSSTDDLAGL